MARDFPGLGQTGERNLNGRLARRAHNPKVAGSNPAPRHHKSPGHSVAEARASSFRGSTSNGSSNGRSDTGLDVGPVRAGLGWLSWPGDSRRTGRDRASVSRRSCFTGLVERVLSADDVASAFPSLFDIEPLGEPGGSGECWRATSEEFGDVALKVLVRPHDPRRFLREVKGLKRVDSPHVKRLHQSGVVGCGGAERPFLLGGLVEGPNLRTALPPEGLGPARGAELLAGLLRGLRALADAHVVHRDMKPENVVLVDGDPSIPVIIDLGLCRLGPDSSLTQYPWYGGTARYSAPEQLRREPALDRSDVWAVGLIAVEAVAGVHPYLGTGGTLPDDYLEILRSEMGIPPSIRGGIRDLLLRMTEYAAYKRPSARSALADLAKEQSGESS